MGYSYRDQGRRRRAEEREVILALDADRARRERVQEVLAADAEVARIEADRRRAREERDEEGYGSPTGQQAVAEALAWVEQLGIGFRRSSS